MDGTVYLLHFSAPLGSDSHRAAHYVGWCLDLDKRLAEHRAGQGAAITRAAVARGITLTIVRTWPGTRALERHIKNRKDAPLLCPHCAGAAALGRCNRDVQQLTLDLDDVPKITVATTMDAYEFLTIRRWKESGAVYVPTGHLDDDLL